MTFLKTLIIIVAIWYFFKFAIRFFGPILLNKAIQKAGFTFQQRSEDFYNQQNNKSNEYTDSQNKSMNFENGIPREKKKVGEYIDFEEIK